MVYFFLACLVLFLLYMIALQIANIRYAMKKKKEVSVVETKK